MKGTSFLLLILLLTATVYGQRMPVADTSIVTKHHIVGQYQSFDYSAITGQQPVWDEGGDVLATVHFTYYTREDVSNRSERPLVISFNGGPGSGSVWMHLAYTGPRLLNIDEEGYPLQPYGVKENPYTILDVADIVFVDPVNTGFSRILDDTADRSQFFGVNADIKYLAEWINTFVTRFDRWTSPKYLIGESYGTTRVAGLARELQEAQWMYLNGVILVSPTDLGINRAGAVEQANRWPYYAATAWFHNRLDQDLQQIDLEELLPRVETFAINDLLPALAKGASIDSVERMHIIKQMSRFSGLSEIVIAQNNLNIPTNLFWKELLRDEGKTVGRLDSRYIGIDFRDAGERPDYNAELSSWLHSFTPAINHYYANELDYKTDVKYNMFGPVHPWDRSRDNTGMDLRKAMAENPFLQLMVQSGYYDGACDYFNAKYNLWQMDPSGKLNSRIRFKGYRSGHMMYLRKEDLIMANEDIRTFIKESLPKPDQPAKY